MSDTITIYRVPEGSYVPSHGQINGQYLGPLPSGDYFEMPNPARTLGRTCLVPRDYPGGLRFYWVNTHEVDRFAKRFIPEDHTAPDGDSCYLGLNFTDEQWEKIEYAMDFARASHVGETPEGVLSEICEQWVLLGFEAAKQRKGGAISGQH